MRIVIALGGNALLRRGEPMNTENQRHNMARAAKALARVARKHELVISHGNGPQVGLLALQASAGGSDPRAWPLDVLGAQSEGMIGYLVEQEMGNELPDRGFATLLTQVEVDPADPAFDKPTKPIGPVYDKAEAERLAGLHGWTIAPDNAYWRRVVPSPSPKRIFEVNSVRLLLEHGIIVICSGGGGIPTMYGEDGRLHGVEAVIDKDRVSSLLARELKADMLVILTDVDGVYTNWGEEGATPLRRAAPDALCGYGFASGSMAPKIEAACEFVEATGNTAVIGSLDRLDDILDGAAGTRVDRAAQGLEWYPA